MSGRPSIGEILAGRYELRKTLGESATRVAYRAFDREVEAEVTLWWLRPELFPSAAHRAAFERSVTELRQPASPHLLRLFEAGRDEDAGQGLLYLTLQRGTTAQLEEHIGAGVVASPGRVRIYAEALAAALDAAHSTGRHHGWIEPRDVVEVAGQIKLAGVGLFGAMQAEVAINQWGHSKRYLAPELLAGTTTSPACDWYSVAAILVDLASGRAAGTFKESKEQLAIRNPAQLHALSAALSERPSDRPVSGEAFLRALSDVWPSQGNVVITKQEEVQTDLRARAPGAGYDPDFDGPGARIDSVSFLDDDEEGTLVHESPSSRVRTLIDEDTGPTIDQDVGAPNHGVTLEEVGPRDPDTVDDSSSSRLKMVSMKPESGRAPTDGPLKSPAKPVLRPLSSLVATPEPGDLGNIAPPKKPKKSRLPLILAVAGVIIVAGVALAIVGLSKTTIQPKAAPEIEEPPPLEIPPINNVIPLQPMRIATPPTGPCPEGMVEIPEVGICVDLYESPGEGLPEISVSLEAARAACVQRSARLCLATEWETACRGEKGASWPYAQAFREEICNIRGGEVEPSGQRSECQNHLGIFDMSGNVAEWVEEGQIRGGSSSDESEARCSQRRSNPERHPSYSDVGFRCCTEAIASQEPSD